MTPQDAPDAPHPDYAEGYMDGLNRDCPEPNANRSERYKHSFAVGRAEINGHPIPYKTSMQNVEKVERIENDR